MGTNYLRSLYNNHLQFDHIHGAVRLTDRKDVVTSKLTSFKTSKHYHKPEINAFFLEISFKAFTIEHAIHFHAVFILGFLLISSKIYANFTITFAFSRRSLQWIRKKPIKK